MPEPDALENLLCFGFSVRMILPLYMTSVSTSAHQTVEHGTNASDER